MNRDTFLERREVLRLLLSLPVGMTVGCDLESRESANRTSLPSPEESLTRLIQMLGPWSGEEEKAAERFGERYLAAQHAVGTFLPGSSELIRSLASRFPADAIGFREVDLNGLALEERELLVTLVKQLYSFIEVRFVVSGEPPWGECPEDRLRHTHAPVGRVDSRG